MKNARIVSQKQITEKINLQKNKEQKGKLEEIFIESFQKKKKRKIKSGTE